MTTRILLIDDHPAYLERARALLEEQEGVEVVGIAQSGEEAIMLCAGLRPDLVLVDYQMPGLNGIETTQALKAQDPTLAVIIVTGYDYEEHRIAAAEAGATDFVSKLEFTDELSRILAKHGRSST
ncbi:MAG: response regulator transcription factor [Gemmatimonadota bacterium]|nr:MAG: response regulator transcription factor [Gemmatimonadota bacterium]